MTYHLIHGIHTQGPAPIEALKDWLPKGSVKYPDYGFVLGVETRLINPVVVGSLLPYVDKQDVVIAHSNGCAIAYDMVQRGLEVRGLVFINAALGAYIVRPPGVGWIDVYFNHGDEWTVAAQLAADLGLADTVWGEMGHSGYQGNDPKIQNIDCAETNSMPRVSGHHDFFTPSKVLYWGPFLARRIVQNG